MPPSLKRSLSPEAEQVEKRAKLGGPAAWDLPKLRAELKTHFGYDAFRPGQEKVVMALMRKESAAAIFVFASTTLGRSTSYTSTLPP